ncbi:MAG: hypothetical protein ACLQVJ_27230 [Syntrophobacteraceae bacterium]
MHLYQGSNGISFCMSGKKTQLPLAFAIRRAFTILLVLLPLAVVLSGCATTAGVNQHQNFENVKIDKLPLTAEVVGGTDLETHTQFDESTKTQMKADSFVMGGLGGLLGAYVGQNLVESADIRGKFLAGKVFSEFIPRLSAGEGAVSDEAIQFRLIHFQQYIPPRGGLKASMTFETRLLKAGDTVVSSYDSEWEFGAILPNSEKNMLREFIEQSLVHWSTRFMTYYRTGNSAGQGGLHFPPPENGVFSGKEVLCNYQLFDKPVPPDLVQKVKIADIQVAYAPEVEVSARLKSLLVSSLKEKIAASCPQNPDARNAILKIEISKAQIAAKLSTILSGNYRENLLRGNASVFASPDQGPLCSCLVKSEHDFGGQAMFLDVEKEMAERFSSEMVRQIMEVK